jgi:hypothetical protein
MGRRYSAYAPLEASRQIFEDDVNGFSSTSEFSFMLSANQIVPFLLSVIMV